MRFKLFRLFLVTAAIFFVGGCAEEKKTEKGDAKKLPFEGVTLKLLVVDDSPLAEAIKRMRGEWNQQTGSELAVESVEASRFSTGESFDADAAIVSSAQVAALAEKNFLTALPKSMRQTDSWGDIFELPKLREAAWGEQIVAVPLGSPVLTLYYRHDLVKNMKKETLPTWKEYIEFINILAEEKKASPDAAWTPVLEPLAPGWAGLTLLSHAAPYIKHRENYSALFDMTTMEPQIAGPAMVRALEELVAVGKLIPPESRSMTPEEVRRAFWEGKTALAMTWPSAADPILSSSSHEKKVGESTKIKVGFAPLPGSDEVYRTGSKRWESRPSDETRQVTFLGIAGRFGVVSQKSTQSEAAFHFLLWLSEPTASNQTGPFSRATTLFRRKQTDEPQPWVERQIKGKDGLKYADAAASALNQNAWLALRIPGREEYLAALDAAVAEAVAGTAKPQESLEKAQKAWQAITEKYGKERQKTAYLHSLGLE